MLPDHLMPVAVGLLLMQTTGSLVAAIALIADLTLVMVVLQVQLLMLISCNGLVDHVVLIHACGCSQVVRDAGHRHNHACRHGFCVTGELAYHWIWRRSVGGVIIVVAVTVVS